jgi:ribosomal protein L7Ae-like RNA K-turn-binding protein
LPTKKELGESVGIPVGTSAVAVENAGAAAEKLQDIVKKLPKHGQHAAPHGTAPHGKEKK